VRQLPGRLVLIGHPLDHSLSPRFQDAALAAAGIPVRYELLDVLPDEVSGAIEALRYENAAGNVTVPHKLAVAGHCQRLTHTAMRVGAINAFRFEDGQLVGENTDVAGFREAAESILGAEPRGLHVALLGAGGAAAAVCAAVEGWEGSRLTIHARRPGQAALLAARFPDVAVSTPTVTDAIRAADVVVNATPVGLHGDDMPTGMDLLPRDAAVMDLAYRVGETPWVRAAREAGHRATDGLEMLIAQGARAFEWWFGIEPDREVMRRALGP
jgi:shikimate dehydrogenase